jgi:hypothetical protein
MGYHPALAPAQEDPLEASGTIQSWGGGGEWRYYSSTFTAAAEAGPKSAVRFMQEFGDEFKQTVANTSELRCGLMTFQAAVHVQSFHNNPDTVASAVKQLKTLRKVLTLKHHLKYPVSAHFDCPGFDHFMGRF